MLSFDSASPTISNDKKYNGSVQWSSPSNIAIIKYWGKYGRQLPKNPSISFTLNNAKTITKIDYKNKSTPSNEIELVLIFEGERNQKFENKIKNFFNSILDVFPFLDQLVFTITSSNSFPHSAGIASSASAMSAIACCLCEIEHHLFSPDMAFAFDDTIKRRASYIARLGSGSASRSIFPSMAIWGTLENSKLEYSNLYANKFDDISPIFKTYHDDILIVSKKEKSVSSTAGHQLMETNVYANARYEQANHRMSKLLIALKEGDQNTFGKIAEDEALTLHALMMSSDPSYLLMHPNTLNVINKVRAYRRASGKHLYFTLDAGPNVHLLYPDNESKEIQVFIRKELLPYCEDGLIIMDNIGAGSEKL